jgi:methyl-accepting chemotaxis protein/methyl-accepting chemotaxis protein-1 (serine sensor receptor)
MQMEQVTQTTAATAEESAAAAEELNAQSESLKEIVLSLMAMLRRDGQMPVAMGSHSSAKRSGSRKASKSASPSASAASGAFPLDAAFREF